LVGLGWVYVWGAEEVMGRKYEMMEVEWECRIERMGWAGIY